MKDLYIDKDQKYYSLIRKDIVDQIEGKNLNILEVGAAKCDTLVYLKEAKIANFVMGVDIMKFSNSNQENPIIDKLIIDQIENINFDQFESTFDYIILGDVLEHLYDPWQILNVLKNTLKPKGKIIISLPNIRFLQSFYRIIIKGTFKYDESGLFDKTHIRFFCKSDLKKMVNEAGFSIKKIDSILEYDKNFKKLSVFNKCTFRLFEEFLTLQYILVGEKQ
jgi:2-polyprenyl-3-methyl-5-hydroxy-6-metoxy-1,4-benzoquinol methylase